MTKQRTILTEDFVQNAVVEHLHSKGWSKSLNSAKLWEHGVDIKVRNNNYGRYWLVEVKGDPSAKVKSPTGSRSSSFNSAMGQIITRMHSNRSEKYRDCYHGYKYGLAFSIYFCDMVIKKTPYNILRRLNLYIFFVDEKGNVKEINWQKLKKLQKDVLLLKNNHGTKRNDYAFKKPKSFSLRDNEYKVTSWTNLITRLCEQIYKENKKDFKKVLGHSSLRGKKRPYFSKNKHELTKDNKKIKGTNIYVETRFNANNIVGLCKKVLKLFNYSKDSFGIEKK